MNVWLTAVPGWQSVIAAQAAVDLIRVETIWIGVANGKLSEPPPGVVLSNPVGTG